MISTTARIGSRWGLILGGSVVLWTLALHVLGFYTVNLGAGQTADVWATALPVLAVLGAFRERLKQVDAITFGEALRLALILGLTSACITVPFLWVYHHYVNPQWLDLLIAWTREGMTAAGRSPADIAQAVGRLQSSGSDRAQVISGFMGSIGFAVILALLATSVLRIRAVYSRPRTERPQE